MRTMLRCLAVWGVATGVAGFVLAWLVPDLALLSRGRVGDFESLLVTGCTLAGLACTVWLWGLVTLVVAEALQGRPARAGVPAVVRRVVLAACGLSLAGAFIAPAQADRDAPPPESGSAAEALVVGLPVPDRATTTTEWLGTVAGSRPAREAPPAETRDAVRVEPGDTLWGLAGATLPADATADEIDRRWRAIYRANRDTIGADPDLIRPGQRLVLPPTGAESR